MITLGRMRPAKGACKNKKRVGRGIGSGHGRTSTRGGKGQTARSGGKIRAGFEGGQTPLYRITPKRGFTNIFRTEYNLVNLDRLNQFSAGSKVGPKELADAGLLRNAAWPVKVLGRGKVDRSIKVACHKISASARAAIEAAGGSIEEI